MTFLSDAANLVPDDTNGSTDIFVHDRQTGTTTRASIASDGSQSNNHSELPSISTDGRYVAFESAATNLVSGDTNGAFDIFVRDMRTGTTTRVSVAAGAIQGNNDSRSAAISNDGRYVAFHSFATNLAPGDINSESDVFVHDRQASTLTLISVAPDGTNGDSASARPSISADGRYASFDSAATDLVTGDTNNTLDVFVRQLF